ncbi:hypothetical protein [Actinoallomurus sp. NPDC050550]|uniref:NACHT domain-containing protein n=1 Tax=Actinoallomurus sp. NPDC050550 TaxID=3154937 RepID=UPI003405322C
MHLLPEINFEHMRGKAPSGSRRDGFEELCSQLMISGGLVAWPPDTIFSTFGNPDGGREGRGVLSSGASWCWQAKYLFELGDAAFSQIDKSVRRAISTEANLARYYVLLPYDPPAGDTPRTKSAFTKWNEYVERREAAAESVGKTVRFIYLGEHQLRSCLLQPSQVGRLRYWFDLDGFSDERFIEIVARAEADVGERYSPELNVGLPISQVFEGLGRTTAFQDVIRVKLGALRKARGDYGLSVPEVETDLFRQAIDDVNRCLDQLDEVVVLASSQARGPDGVLPDLLSEIEPTWQPLDSVSELLRKYCLRDGCYVGNAAGLASEVRAIRSAINELSELAHGRDWQSFGQRAVLITGTGGSGKTHLLCDLAKKRTATGLPTLIALGEQFEKGPIDAELSRIIGFNGPPGQLLATFDAACQTAGEIGLLIIDALNEATDRKLWSKYLGSFFNEVAQRPHLRLVLSCRTEFLVDTFPSRLQDHMMAFQHTGFAEFTRGAIRQFLDWYNIERPSFPMLDPEFTNPLFLKLLCTTLQQRGEHSFPRTGVGTTWIYDSFLDAIDARLGAEDRCDYDPASGLVRIVVAQLASAMYAGGRRLAKTQVEAMTSALLPDRPWSVSLLNGLLKEGLLSEHMVDGTSYIRFGYERLGDIAIGRLIAAKDLSEIEAECRRMAERWYQYSGVLQALASVLPEIHGVELIDMLDVGTTEYHFYAHGDFLRSLAWRQSTAVSDRSVELLEELQKNADVSDAATNALLQVAAVPNHKLNAAWLHIRLMGTPLPERDATWSWFCDRQDDVDGHLPVLIEWAWSDASTAATDEVRYLVALTLSWALSSSNRLTRDNSTKALIALLEESPPVYQQMLRDFRGVDDDYIEERLLSVGCGIAQRAERPESVFVVADAVRDFTLTRGYWPENLHSRDYVRRVIEEALEREWTPGIDDIATRIRPPYESTWIQECRSQDEIEAMSGPPDYFYSSVSHKVMSDFDDFRKYIIDSVLREFDLPSEVDADVVARLIFDQVLTLGWTPQRFQSIDRNLPRQSSGEGKKLEGFAQKYIWIAFKRISGRIADHHRLRPDFHGGGRTQYDTPLDAYGHDIDPTVLLRRTENRTYEDTSRTWFAPIDVAFPVHLDGEWPNNDSNVPQVDRLLVGRHHTGSAWLVLDGHYQWSQPQPPEDAATREPHHQIWTQIRSYIIDPDHVGIWREWAEGQNWNRRWSPESGSPSGLLLADHPYKSDWPSPAERDGTYREELQPPGDYMITTTRYGGVANDLDQSDSKHLYGLLPSTSFCALLGLQRMDDFRWGAEGTVLAENFSIREVGPDTIHVSMEALASVLRADHRCLLWTIIGEKQTLSKHFDWLVDGKSIIRAFSASYIFDGEIIRLLYANSRTLHVGGGESNNTAWSLPARVLVDAGL